jgi:hypothetical protein
MVFKATEIALTRNMIKPEEIPMIKAEFYKRLANKADQIYIGWSAFEILKTSKIDRFFWNTCKMFDIVEAFLLNCCYD